MWRSRVFRKVGGLCGPGGRKSSARLAGQDLYGLGRVAAEGDGVDGLLPQHLEAGEQPGEPVLVVVAKDAAVLAVPDAPDPVLANARHVAGVVLGVGLKR